MPLTMTMPWPPSVNTYWRHLKSGKTLISAEGRLYRRTVGWEAKRQGCRSTLAGGLKVTLWAYPPDRRRRDLDNLLKAVLDALTGIAWEDDSQIDDLRIIRGAKSKSGRLLIEIGEIEETLREREGYIHL